jgi:tetratricopeptide (TPR) repeat protein
MVRLVVNKARHHYNLALEHVERGRIQEAIDELRNALDLYGDFPQAHVVLGKLYARMGDFEKARECWERALALNPDLKKAHDGLQKLESVAQAIPVLRLMRITATVLGAVCLVLVVIILWMSRADESGQYLAKAHAAYREGKYATALTYLAKTLETAKPNTPTAAAAASLRDALQLDLRQKIQFIQELKHRDEYPRALALIAELETHEPDMPTSVALSVLKQDINHYYRDKILALYNQFLSGEVTYPELASKVGEFLQLYPDIPEKEELRKFLDDAREYAVAQEMEQIRKQFNDDHNVTATIEAVQSLAAKYPGTDTMKKMRSELVDEILSWMFNEFQSLLDQQKYSEAAALLNHIRDLASEFKDIVDVVGPVELASRVLAENERSHRLREIDKYINSGQFDTAQDLIWDLMFDDTLTTAEKAVVAAAQERLENKQLESAVSAIRTKKASYLSLKISTEEATKSLEIIDKALRSPVGAQKEVRTDLLACGVAAAVKAKDIPRAQRYLEMLGREKGTERLVAQLRKLVTPQPPPTQKKK